MSPRFVVCSACGARIRADRNLCLRCGEPLVAAAPPAPADAPGSWTAYFTSGPGLIIGVFASLALVVVLAIVMMPHVPVDEPARPVVPPGGAATPRPNAVAGETAAESPASIPEPVTALEVSRAGKMALSQGDLPAARTRYEHALERNPNDADALNDLGLVMMRQNQVTDAIAKFARAAELMPSKWAYHFNLAQALGQSGDWTRAIAEYRVAQSLFPDDYATQYNLAMAMHKSGDDAGAVPEFQKAIALAPSESSFHISLGISLEKLGRMSDAQKEFQTYLEMDPSAPDAEKVKSHLSELAAAATKGTGD